MATRTRRKRGSRESIAGDLEILPLMNLFIVLIPLLLLSAVFVEVSVIDMTMPSNSEANQQRESLALKVHIREDAYLIQGNGIPSQTISRAAADGTADTALSGALVGIAQAHPDNQQIQIISQPSTLYDEIIGVMDISRAAGLSSTALVAASEAS